MRSRSSQDAYIKFGLILEQFRNKSWWKRCQEQFRDFREFCKQKVNLSRWQVVNAIKSANVAVKLVFLGYSDLPRNASQALALADLSLERLSVVWGGILERLMPHQITTDGASNGRLIPIWHGWHRRFGFRRCCWSSCASRRGRWV